MKLIRGLITAAVALSAALALAGPASASAAAVPGQRLHPGVSAQVSCGFYSGTELTQRGNTGNRVKEAQCLLVFWGYSVGPAGIDGKFGPDTEGAVHSFQSDTNIICTRHLTVDSKVGVHTWSALRSSDSCPTV